MDNLLGITSEKWWQLLKENNYSVDPQYLGRALLLTGLSLNNTRLKKKEDFLFSAAWRDVQVVKPLFIIGHWRSGTTLLHYLLSQDDQFAYPTIYQVSNPHTFLVRGATQNNDSNKNQALKRPMDDILITSSSPGEDEFAISVTSLRSPIIGWSFPRREAFYDQFLTFEGVQDDVVEEWISTLKTFYQKLCYMHQNPLLLKSPPHTARIKILLDMFPDARFIHIHRNPYKVFQSTYKLYRTAIPNSYLQNPKSGSPIEGILKRYANMYDNYFDSIKLLGVGQIIDLSFEEFIKDMIGTIQKIYNHLDLKGYDQAEQKFMRYIATIADHKPSEYETLPDTYRNEVSIRWRQSFEQWKYKI